MPTSARFVAGGWREPAVVAALLVFVAWSIYGLIDPQRPPAAVSERLDIGITTLATVVAGAVAFLEWGRYRVDRRAAALYRAAAFLALGAANGLPLAIMLGGLDPLVGMTLDAPGQWPLWVGIVGRGTAAALFLLGGIAALQRSSGPAPRKALLVFWGPALLVLALLVLALALLAAFAESLPTLLDTGGARGLAADPRQPPQGTTPLFVLGQLLPAAAYLVAAVLSYVAFRRDRAAGQAILATGLVVAALGQVHSAIHPGAYTSLVTSGDLLRMLFSIGMLVGLVIENGLGARALRNANDELRRLHDVELAEATLEERARLAREIHDGLAQDLWYAKLKQSRLVQLMGNGEGRELAAEVVEALDSALGEARQAVMALRPAAGGTLLEVLQRYVDDFGDRFGIRADFRIVGRPREIDVRAQAEVLRVVQEALNNVRKHADATVVRIEVRFDGVAPVITITDNGRGFERKAESAGYGLRSMEERLLLIGGELAIHSAPQDGTTVEVRLPPPGAA